MQSTLLLLVLLLTPTQQIEVGIAQGPESQVPTEWTALEEVTSVSIGKSYWAKVSIQITLPEKHVLQGGNWYMKDIHFYDQNMNLIGVGNEITLSPTPQHQTVYLFYEFHDEKDPENFSIKIYPQEEFLNLKFNKNVFQSAFHSVLIFIILISCFFIMRSKNNIYLHYALYIATIIIFFSYQYGVLGNAFPFVNKIPPNWIWIFSASLSFTYLLFAQSFLNLREADPFNYKIARFGQLYILIVMSVETVSYLFMYDILHEVWYKATIIIIQFSLCLIFIYRIFLLKTIISNIFLIGAFVLFLTTMTGQIASTFKLAYETNLFVQIGLLLDVFILSIGIAVRVGLIQKARTEAQEKLIDQLQLNEQMQQEYTENLEGQVTERTAALNKRNIENETLLKEVHHRVKNNLQMITSLLNMQQRRLKTESSKEALALTKNRVKSIGLIHEHLYKHDDFSKINLREYVEELTKMLIKSLHKGNKVEITIDILDLKADIETAIPIGLILNELITNSIKYAFEGNKSPNLQVKMKETEDELVLQVIDNGPGIGEKTDLTGFGHTIVDTLLESLSGEIEHKESEDGFHVLIKLKDYQIFSTNLEI